MFKRKLKELREQRGLSQMALAKKVCLSQSLIAAFEMGTRKPNSAALIALADVLDCTTDYLLGRTDK